MSDQALPSKSILVVDDTPASGYLLRRLLEGLGQRAKSVSSAAAALDSIQAERPDIVISDLSMPIMDGFELARRVRADAVNSGMLLVALSGLSSDKAREQARDAGFDQFLVKPVGLPALRALLASFPG
jgi:CheY-like chemotaxis protein